MKDKRLPGSDSEDESEPVRFFEFREEPTQSLDLGRLFTTDITSSGSFDIRGGIWASTFGKLLQALPIPALMVDQHHCVIAANQACARIAPDYQRIQGHQLAMLFPNASEADKASGLLGEVFETRKPGLMQGMLRIGKGSIWARLTLRSIRMVDVRAVLVLVEDLTNERKLLILSRKYQHELEQRVEERTADLRQANIALQTEMSERKKAEGMLIQSERLRAVGQMSAGVAHNLKNLIQMLFGLTTAALNQLHADNALATRNELEKIVQTLQHGAETVRRLQDFAKTGAGAYSEKGTVFELSGLIRQAIDFTKPFWETYPQTRGIKIVLKARLADKCFVRGNQGQLFEVLVNLIKNAAESLDHQGEIDLVTSIEEDKVVFRVRDTGAGIRQEDMDRVFTPFFTTKGEAGSGLGLATSRGIIGNHGGTITVKSTYGQGTTFTVRLPLAKSQPEGSVKLALETNHRRLNILAVDDMESTLTMLRLGLEGYQHRVLTALSGEEALEIYRSGQVDVVVCDLAMPGMTGWEVGRSMSRLCKEKGKSKTPFLLLTAWGHQSFDETTLYESGVDAVLEKPVDIGRLMEVIADITR